MSTASRYEKTISNCTTNKNTICSCVKGYYKSRIDSETYECLKCQKCGENENQKKECKCETFNKPHSHVLFLSVQLNKNSFVSTGTSEGNTVCECKENYYRVKKKCEPCRKWVMLMFFCGDDAFFFFFLAPIFFVWECFLFNVRFREVGL